jgi:hypothetical protein
VQLLRQLQVSSIDRHFTFMYRIDRHHLDGSFLVCMQGRKAPDR